MKKEEPGEVKKEESDDGIQVAASGKGKGKGKRKAKGTKPAKKGLTAQEKDMLETMNLGEMTLEELKEQIEKDGQTVAQAYYNHQLNDDDEDDDDGDEGDDDGQ